MLNLGSHRDVTWPDDWTVTTVDGKRSAQFEETIIVTENGCEILTRRGVEPVKEFSKSKGGDGSSGVEAHEAVEFGWDVATGERVDGRWGL